MTETRAIDKAATKDARDRQAAGFARLDDAFGIPPELRRLRGFVLATTIDRDAAMFPTALAYTSRPEKRGATHVALTGASPPLRHRIGCPIPRSDRAWSRKRKRRAAKLARRASR